MRAIHSQAGIGHVAIVLVLLFVGVAGFAGYKVMSKNKAVDTSAVAESPKVPEKISNKADLETTSKALDNSSKQLDNGLNDGALDDDLNDML